MRLKTFHANTMTEAMQMIRDTLGEDAIIVATGEDHVQGNVRVTAAVEPAFEIGDNQNETSDDGWLQYDEENDTDAVAEELTEIMLKHAASEDVMDHMISCATAMGFDDIGIALVTTLEQLFNFSPLPVRAYSKPIMMVGPPGAGKTLAVAKLAARGAMNDLKVGVISTDTVRAGGIEQLKAFTDLLKIDLKKANDYRDLGTVITDLSQANDQVIIDTPGLNPFDKNEVKVLARMINAADMRPVMVLPAGTDAEEAGEMARVFATIGADEILPTRVDMARRLGSLLSAAHHGSLSFSDVSTTHKVAHGLVPLSPHALAQLLMPRLYKSQKNDIVNNRTSRLGAQKTGT